MRAGGGINRAIAEGTELIRGRNPNNRYPGTPLGPPSLAWLGEKLGCIVFPYSTEYGVSKPIEWPVSGYGTAPSCVPQHRDRNEMEPAER